jgi:hypothetical protein
MTKRAKATQQSLRDGGAVEDSADLTAWRYRHELRRSSAAQPHANRKRYTRKAKHPARGKCGAP